MTAQEIREQQERIKKLREEKSAALLLVRKAYEPVAAVKAQAGPHMNFEPVTILKGTADEKEDAFGKLLGKHEDAFKAFKAADKALKAELKATKAEKKAEKIERKNAKILEKSKQAESWSGVNISFGGGMGELEDDESRFNWKSIKIPHGFDNYEPTRVASTRSAKGVGLTKRQSYAAGMAFTAQLGKGRTKAYAQDFMCDTFQTKALGTNVNEQGAGWIPTEFYPVLTQLIQEYGSARKLLTVWPAPTGTLRAPRLNALTQIYGEDEKQIPTEGTFDMTTIEVTCRKFMGLSYFPTELLERSPMAIGDIVTQNYARAMAKKEDQCLYFGDGTPTYNRMVGLKNKLLAVSSTLADIAGLYQSTATAMADITRTDVTTWMGQLPKYAFDLGKPVIQCTQQFYNIVLRGKAAISQSTYGTEVVNGIPQYKFDGYDVEIVNVLPSTDGSSGVGTIFAWFGVPGLAAKMADNRAYTMKVSDQYQFGKDMLTYLATEIIGIVVHDVGSFVGDTVPDTFLSPMVALATAGTLS